MSISPARRLGAVAALALAALVALPGVSFAATNPQIAATGGMTATLPILGGGVNVTVALDPAGNISGVTVSNPALVKGASSNTFAKFATADGKTKITVRAWGSKMSLSARVTSLAELVGTGTWSANVFGNGTSSASYTIGSDSSGNPTVSLTDPAPLASGVTWKAATPKTSMGDGGATASSGGTFSFQGFTKTLRIAVKVDKGEDGDPGSASLNITLTGRDVQKLSDTLANLAAAGVRTWSGYLCDGTTKVTVSYHVNTDGTIGFDSATGGTAVQKTAANGRLFVSFQGTNVGLWVSLKNNNDGTYSLQVRGFSGNCGKPGKGGHDGHGFGFGGGGQQGGGDQGKQTSFGGGSGSGGDQGGNAGRGGFGGH